MNIEQTFIKIWYPGRQNIRRRKLFFEAYNQAKCKNGIEYQFIQDNQSFSPNVE
jgi:dTDP-4-dehydrorhamnose 3,5-epimerase-like enzyme